MKQWTKWKTLIAQILIILIPNIIAWLILFPGYFQADHQTLISSIINNTPYQGNSLIWGYVSLPFFYYSPTYACYGLFQITLFCICIIFGIGRLTKCMIIKKPIILTIIMSLFPTFIIYNLLYSSEIILAYFIFDLTCLLIEYVVETNNDRVLTKSYWIYLFIFITLCLLIRKNSILIPILIIIVILLTKRKYLKKFIIIGISSLVISYATFTGFEIFLCKDNSTNFQGTTTIVPSYQIAGTYAKNGLFSEEADKYFQSIKTKEEWINSYKYATADESSINVVPTIEFFKYYLETGFYNIDKYIISYLKLEGPLIFFGYNLSYDKMAMDNGISIDFAQYDNFTLTYNYTNINSLRETYINQFGEQHSYLWYKIPPLINNIHKSGHGFISSIIDIVLLNRGLPLWTILIGLVICIKYRKTQDFILISIPLVSILFVFLLCCPVVLFRYVVEIYYTLPIIILYLLKVVQKHSSLIKK